jgi:4-amino-4-deoxy-L-arabinose transferase-like glycosyltransferase
VLALLLLVYLGSAISPALLDDADSTHAEAAREMLVRGDYVTLHVNGVRYLEKAPLPYWLVAFSFRVFGVNALAARLPSILAVLLLALLAMAWAGRAFGPRAGIYAGLFAATATGVFLFTRIMIPEALLSLFIAASLYCMLTALNPGAGRSVGVRVGGPYLRWRWYGVYAGAALAVLTKGLVALVFIVLPAGGYLLLTGEWRHWREFRLASGTALFLLIAAPWHLLAGYRNPGFLWFYFVNEHFLRFLGKRFPKDYNKLPVALYWSLQLAWLFPWSLFLPGVVRDLWKDSRRSRVRPGGEAAGSPMGFARQTRLLCALWAGIVLVFFSISTNQEYYTFPSYLPLLILLAGAVAASELRGGSRWLTWSTGALTLVSLAAGAALFAALWSSRHLPYAADIGNVLAKHDLANDTLSLSHMLDLQGDTFAALRLPALLALLALTLGPLSACFLRWRKRHYAATWSLACAMATVLIAAGLAYARFQPYLSSKGLADSIARQAVPQDQVVIYGEQSAGSSLLFYLQRPIFVVNGWATSMWFGSTFPDVPKLSWSDADLVRAWDSGARIFLFVPAFKKPQVDALLGGPKYVVAESSGKTVYSNRPAVASRSAVSGPPR